MARFNHLSFDLLFDVEQRLVFVHTYRDLLNVRAYLDQCSIAELNQHMEEIRELLDNTTVQLEQCARWMARARNLFELRRLADEVRFHRYRQKVLALEFQVATWVLTCRQDVLQPQVLLPGGVMGDNEAEAAP